MSKMIENDDRFWINRLPIEIKDLQYWTKHLQPTSNNAKKCS